MKQYRITTRNIDAPSDTDCILPENDPVHALKGSMFLGGLGASLGPIGQSQQTQELINKYWPEKIEDKGDNMVISTNTHTA